MTKKEIKDLLGDLEHNHKAIGRDISIYSRAADEIHVLLADLDAARKACAERDTLRQQLAESEAAGDARLCESCLETHPVKVPCPPHEMRTTGQAWFKERLASLADKLGAAEKRLAESEAVRERLRTALQSWLTYFDRLDADMEDGDPLKVARQLYHGKRIDVTRAALALPAGRAFAERMQRMERACAALLKSLSEGTGDCPGCGTFLGDAEIFAGHADDCPVFVAISEASAALAGSAPTRDLERG